MFGRGLSWAMLLLGSGLLILGMRQVDIPGALLIGPLMAGIAVALLRPGLAVRREAALFSQAVLGCLIAAVMTPAMLAMLVPRWPLLLGANALLIIGIAVIGLVATRLRIIPGTSAIWGLSPGAASAMVVLAEDYGGDRRLVALLQYLRLVGLAFFVVAFGTAFGNALEGAPQIAVPGAAATRWLARPDAVSLASVLALSATSFLAARFLSWPSLVIFGPVLGGIALQLAGIVTLAVPPLLSAAAFCIIGWNVGLGFTRDTIRESYRMLPRIVLLVLAVLMLCLGLAAAFAATAHVDYITAYLSLNPGGADVVLVTAAHLDVDLPLVMAMQVARILMVMLTVPTIGKLAAAACLRHDKTDG